MNLLECRHLTKRFGALIAVGDVSLTVRPGEILGVIGPNGSGKTTLFNLMAGIFHPDSGEVLLRGQNVSGMPPHRICRLGMTKTSQVVQPFHEMSVFENILVAALYGRRRSTSAARDEVERVLNFVGLERLQDEPARKISFLGRRRLELARALATGAEILLLDEVMAGLTPAEVEETLNLLRKIQSRGCTLLLVEHVMRAIMGISERILVLHHGEKIAEGTPKEISRQPKVITAYLGDRYA